MRKPDKWQKVTSMEKLGLVTKEGRMLFQIVIE